MYSTIDPEFCDLPCRVLMDRSVPTVEASERLTDIVGRLMDNYNSDIIAVDDGQLIVADPRGSHRHDVAGDPRDVIIVLSHGLSSQMTNAE